MYRLQDTGHPQTHRRAWELFGDMGSFLLRLPYHWVPQLLVTMNTSLRFCSQNVTVTSLQVASYSTGWHRFSTIMLLVLMILLFVANGNVWFSSLSPFFSFLVHLAPSEPLGSGIIESSPSSFKSSPKISRFLQTQILPWAAWALRVLLTPFSFCPQAHVTCPLFPASCQI